MRNLKQLQQSATMLNGMYLTISNVTKEEIANAIAEGAVLGSNGTHEWLVVFIEKPHSYKQLIITDQTKQ